MEKFLKIKNLLALILIGIAVYEPILNVFPPLVKPDVAILNIDKPSDEIIALVKPVSDLVSDPNDRAKLAIYSQEFSNRVKNYDVELQQLNDVLSISAKEFFQGSMNDKYEGLDDKIIFLITSAAGEDNHHLTDQEKNTLSERFLGLAWSLIQRK